MMSERYQNLLLEMAKTRFHGYQIIPFKDRTGSYQRSFIEEGGECVFWFNTTKDNSTRIIKIKTNRVNYILALSKLYSVRIIILIEAALNKAVMRIEDFTRDQFSLMATALKYMQRRLEAIPHVGFH